MSAGRIDHVAAPGAGGLTIAVAQGNANWTFTLSSAIAGAMLHVQSVEGRHATQVARVHVH